VSSHSEDKIVFWGHLLCGITKECRSSFARSLLVVW